MNGRTFALYVTLVLADTRLLRSTTSKGTPSSSALARRWRARASRAAAALALALRGGDRVESTLTGGALDREVHCVVPLGVAVGRKFGLWRGVHAEPKFVREAAAPELLDGWFLLVHTAPTVARSGAAQALRCCAGEWNWVRAGEFGFPFPNELVAARDLRLADQPFVRERAAASDGEIAEFVNGSADTLRFPKSHAVRARVVVDVSALKATASSSEPHTLEEPRPTRIFKPVVDAISAAVVGDVGGKIGVQVAVGDLLVGP